MIGNPTVLLPAYGRKYESAEEAKKDWDNGKDFLAYTIGGYCSKRDFGILDHAVILYSVNKQVSVFGDFK